MSSQVLEMGAVAKILGCWRHGTYSEGTLDIFYLKKKKRQSLPISRFHIYVVPQKVTLVDLPQI